MATSVEQFSKDHWSTFAYAETRCVDGKDGMGFLERARMRCNPHRHPLLGSNGWAPSYGTRLKGYWEFENRANPAKAFEAGVQLIDHDDWDCLEDLEAAGFLEILSLTQGAIRMNELGFTVAAALRKYKAQGGMYATFAWPLEMSPA